MFTLKNSAGTPNGRLLASSRSSDGKKAGKGALWFESSAQKLEDQESAEAYAVPPPSERGTMEPPIPAQSDPNADKR